MIRNEIKKQICAAAGMFILIILSVACEDFNELNTPPDEIVAENVDGSLLGQAFAFAQMSSFFGEGNNYQAAYSHYGNAYSQYKATIHPNFDMDQLEVANRHMILINNNYYENTAPQLQFVENYSAENGLPVVNAMAKIWRVVAYHRMTDLYGPVIYSQFGNGETSVAYDAQEDIYMDFFQTLDEAIAVLEQNRGGNAFGSHDQMYAGNVDQWILFANSLRLRLATRVVYVEPELAEQEAEKAIAGGIITGNSDNAELVTTINSENPLSSITYHDEFRMSATLHSVLVGWNDPRLPVYLAEVWNGGGYKGLRNGLPADQKDRTFLTNNYSAVGNRWRPLFSGPWGEGGVNAPVEVLLAAEVYFLRAEGALRGWDMGGGTAEEYYNEGIRMSLSQDRIGASAAEIEDYITGTDLPVGIDDPWGTPPMTDIPVLYQPGAGFEKQLEQIITQKWLALFPEGIEAWTERRRTGYPVGYAVINSINPNIPVTGLVRRQKYSSEEYSNNAVAVEAALDLLGGPDGDHIRVWWDKKPLGDYPTPTQ
ncbi:MAG: SusD/RagB family nutrient-binding outer membrane lipoprotein [Balneolaceae bacterium]